MSSRWLGNKLDVFLSSLRKQVKQYNDVITRDVREHSCSRSVTREAIEHATSSITQLFNKIKQIKETRRRRARSWCRRYAGTYARWTTPRST